MQTVKMNQNRLLNVEFIQEKLDEGYQYTEETKDRDLVLVIGNTGVGKSTSCNYLLSYRMKEEIYKGRPVIETVEETQIQIGHMVKSETLYAKSFVIHENALLGTGKSHRGICLLDCPGFLGNRTVEEKVIESVSTELAIRSARQIKGILILISLHVLQETRVTELRELVKTLMSLFKDPVEMVQYSLFIITKKHKLISDDEAKNITIGALSSLKEHCEYQATRYRENPNLSSSEGLTSADYDRISVYFSAVLKKTDNIILINPLDKGESRKVILERINNIKPRKGFLKECAKSGLSLAKKAIGKSEPDIKPITITDFSFSEGNEDRVKFNKALYERAREGNELILKVKGCGETIRKLYSEISSLHTRLSLLGKLQCDFEEEISKTGDGKCHRTKADFESIKQLELIIHGYDIQIESMKREITEICTRRENLEEKLNSIDTGVPIPFIQKSICRYVSWWKTFGWEEMKFEADTGDREVEIIKINKEMKNGTWFDEDDQRESGIYRTTYQSNYRAKPAEATVTTYIKTKDEAGNKIRIQNIKKDCRLLIENETNLKSEIAELESKNQGLQSIVTRAKYNIEDYENDLIRRLQECKNEMQQITAKIPEKEEESKEAKLTGIASLQEFESNRRKFDILISIASLLEFPSAIIKNFVIEYNEFLNCIDNYRSSFSESTDESLLYDNEKGSKSVEENIITLKDPITGDEIKHLVLTSAGTAFEEHSLLEQFDKENALPFVFKRKDGSTEEIGYLSWQKVPDIQNFIDNQRNERIYHHATASSPTSTLIFTVSEINKLEIEQLEELKVNLQKEMQKMKEELEVKETDLERICRRLESLHSNTQNEE